MDMRSSLLGAAIMVASASLPSGAFELYGSETYPNPMAQVTDIKIIDGDDELLDYETAEPIAIVDESEVKNEIVPMEDIYAGDDHKFDA